MLITEQVTYTMTTPALIFKSSFYTVLFKYVQSTKALIFSLSLHLCLTLFKPIFFIYIFLQERLLYLFTILFSEKIGNYAKYNLKVDIIVMYESIL